MRKTRNKFAAVLSLLCLLTLILDAKTGLSGAREGLVLCVVTVIPSLFPLMFLSVIITGTTLGKTSILLSPLRKLCGIPKGAESLLLLSLLGGYPVGAQAVTNIWKQGFISRDTARRLLGFCSNAGPAFIFGMIGSLFENKAAVWALWGIHFASAILVGVVLPKEPAENCKMSDQVPISLTDALYTALKVMAGICGWVILFRVLLAFLGKWFLSGLPAPLYTFVAGLLELTNGCVSLANLPSEGSRFLIASVILGFGGLCVGMQTCGVTGKLGTGLYFPGKFLQAIFSYLLAWITQKLLFLPDQQQATSPLVIITAAVFGAMVIAFLHRKKKVVALSV